jgi:methyl-accepting chemotaxis protein
MIRARRAKSAAKNYDALKSSQILMTAMNTASTHIMVVNVDFTITSINNSLKDMFERNISAIRSVCPDFDCANLRGKHIDILLNRGNHQDQMFSGISSSWAGEVILAGLVIRLSIEPIFQGRKKIGYVMEWLDRTDEANLSREIIHVMQDMEAGKFSSRVLSAATGELGLIKDSINGSMDVISEAVKNISQAMSAQAAGDLNYQLPDAKFKGEFDELKNALHYSLTNLKQVVVTVTDASYTIKASAAEVAQASSGLSERVQQQAASLEKTAASMMQINSRIQQTSAHAQQATALVSDVQQKARQGSSVMSQTISAMQGIKASSKHIEQIVSLIDGIAFQTNLLALNAAVEAARAGENGRGFAVVAGEVRGLAQKSAAAAKDIKKLISESVHKIDEGTQLADASGAALKGITLAIDEVESLVELIASASVEQAQGIHEVNQAMGKIDGVTQQNAALVEETAATAESLREQAHVLEENISFFKTESTPISLPKTKSLVGFNPRIYESKKAKQNIRVNSIGFTTHDF